MKKSEIDWPARIRSYLALAPEAEIEEVLGVRDVPTFAIKSIVPEGWVTVCFGASQSTRGWSLGCGMTRVEHTSGMYTGAGWDKRLLLDAWKGLQECSRTVDSR